MFNASASASASVSANATATAFVTPAELPPALNPTSRVLLAFDDEVNNNVPILTTLTPIRRAGDIYNPTQIFDQMASVFRTHVYVLVRRANPTWTQTQIDARIRGTLIMFNRNNDGHTNAAQDIPINEITGQTLEDLFNTTTNESNPDLSIYDVGWKYFINPNSMIVGGSRSFTNRNGVKGIEMWDKKLKKTRNIEDPSGTIGCAAFALALGYDKLTKSFSNNTKSRFIKPGYTE